MMAASKGHKKWGGRQKGTPNKKTQELHAIAERLGVCPFEILLSFAKGDWKVLGYEEEKFVASFGEHGDTYKYTIDPAVRAKAATEACQYLYPKRKSIDHTINDDSGLGEKMRLALLRQKDAK